MAAAEAAHHRDLHGPRHGGAGGLAGILEIDERRAAVLEELRLRDELLRHPGGHFGAALQHRRVSRRRASTRSAA
jgi:hypothetical protein